jgi:short-subunit dehydrogenase
MAISLKPLDQQVMVITGASSGIGLSTARLASSRGARVVLAARSGNVLRAVENEIRSSGGDAFVVEADVSVPEDVKRIANRAVERYGRFDTWVNNAGLSIFGRLADVKIEDHRRLFEINFWGVVYGSITAAEHLRQYGGAIINVGSVLSDVAVPLQGMYAASKHAVKGFTDALRIELQEERLPISVTLIKPASINTPFPQHAKNYLPKEPRLPDPVYPPKEVALAILKAAEQPWRDIRVGGSSKVMATMASWTPRLMDWLNETLMTKQQMRQELAQHTAGSLYQPSSGGNEVGSHPGPVMNTSLYTRALMSPVARGAMIASMGVATAALIGSMRSRK